MGKNQDRRMDELKRGLRCMDCVAAGTEIEWPSECLDFDHRDPEQKVGSIRSLLHRPDELTLEIAKCDVVCANHHRIRTRQRGVSEKTKAAIRAAKGTPESKAKTSENSRKHWADPIRRARNAKAVSEAQRRPEVLAKNKQSVAASWADPAIRAKRQEAMKAAWVKRREKQSKSLSSEKT